MKLKGIFTVVLSSFYTALLSKTVACDAEPKFDLSSGTWHKRKTRLSQIKLMYTLVTPIILAEKQDESESEPKLCFSRQGGLEQNCQSIQSFLADPSAILAN